MPVTKQQSKQWVKVASSGASAGKVTASVLWNAKGILLINYLEKGRSITSKYYSNLLDQLDVKIHKRPHLKKKKKSSFTKTMHLLTSVLPMGKLQYFMYKLLGNPDLAP
jgi:Transposase.